MGSCKVQCLRAAVHTQASEQAPEMNFDSVFADVELFGDSPVRQALIEHQDQLLLTLGQLDAN